MGWPRGLTGPVPFPFLASLFLCRRFISSYPGLSVSRLRLFLFPSFALCLSRSVFFCLPLLFSVSMSLPLVLSPCLSHPLLTLLSLFLCSYMCFSAYLSFSGSLPLSRSLSCPVSPLLSRRSPPLPRRQPPPPPSLGASPQSLFGWAGGLAGGGGLRAGGGGRERGRAEEGGGWC